MIADKAIKLCMLQIDSCLQHEFGDLYVQKQNRTLKPRRIERKELSFVLQLVKYGYISKKDAELAVWAAKKRGRLYVKQHGEINPTGMGRGSVYLRLFLQQSVAPLMEIAAAKQI